MTNVLDIIDVTVRFGGVTAVAGAGFSVKKGELLGFIGPNGAGKTTLMRVITGIVKPQEGHVLLEGQDLAEHSINKRPGAAGGRARCPSPSRRCRRT